MSVTKKDIDHVSELARINFNEEEKENLIKDLNSVLLYMEKLKELNTDNVEIVVNPYYMENNFREDEVRDSLNVKDVIKNSKENLEDYILVPKILD